RETRSALSPSLGCARKNSTTLRRCGAAHQGQKRKTSSTVPPHCLQRAIPSSLCPPDACGNRTANVRRRGEVLGRAARRRPGRRGVERAALRALLAPTTLARAPPP